MYYCGHGVVLDVPCLGFFFLDVSSTGVSMIKDVPEMNHIRNRKSRWNILISMMLYSSLFFFFFFCPSAIQLITVE